MVQKKTKVGDKEVTTSSLFSIIFKMREHKLIIYGMAGGWQITNDAAAMIRSGGWAV